MSLEEEGQIKKYIASLDEKVKPALTVCIQFEISRQTCVRKCYTTVYEMFSFLSKRLVAQVGDFKVFTSG